MKIANKILVFLLCAFSLYQTATIDHLRQEKAIIIAAAKELAKEDIACWRMIFNAECQWPATETKGTPCR